MRLPEPHALPHSASDTGIDLNPNPNPDRGLGLNPKPDPDRRLGCRRQASQDPGSLYGQLMEVIRFR